MSEFDHLHESEDVWLVSEVGRPCSELWPVLAELGFELDEDVFAIDRSGKIPAWQSRSIIAVYVLRGDQEIYDENAQWDRIRLRYFMATLPAELREVFVEKATSVADRLHIPMRYRGRVVTTHELRAGLEDCLQELRETVGEPSTKEVAVAIETTYPR